MSAETINAIAQLMRASGIELNDLARALDGTTNAAGDDPRAVTFGMLVDQAVTRMTTNTRRTYITHLRRAREGISRCCDCLCPTCTETDECGCPSACKACAATVLSIAPLEDIVVTKATMRASVFEDLAACAERIARKTATRHNRSRARKGLPPRPVHGHNAQETAVAAFSHLMERAIGDGLLETNPVARVRKRRRQQTTKRGLRDHELELLIDAVASGGNDPDLDLLIVWFHLETGARKSGALTLQIGRIHTAEQVVELQEKGSKWRRQPVSTDLCTALLTHAAKRGGPRCQPGALGYDPTAPVFHYQRRDGQPHPLTAKRYETLFGRIQQTLPFAAEISLSAHGLRKSAGTIIERIGGTQVARHFLGHATRSDTDHYTESWTSEVARATTVWTGSEHPLATSATGPDQRDGPRDRG